MKRLHVHVSVDDLAQFIRFYGMLFATTPAVTKPDYAIEACCGPASV